MSPQAVSPAQQGGLAGYIPAWGWLRSYERAWFRGDVVAGLTLAAYLLPAGIGDASLAGLPPEAGLYACLFSGLFFWLFCSSRTTVITVTSAISLLVGSTLGEIAQGDVARYGTLAACTALLVAAIAITAWAARAGSLVNFISESVLVGFKTGVAFHIASSQLPKLFGFKGTHGDFWERIYYFLAHIWDTNAAALTIGLCALLILIAGKLFLKGKPVALFVVIGGIVVASIIDLGSRGVSLLGEVPRGLPALGVDWPGRADIKEILPLAMACFLLGAVETAAIGRSFATQLRTRFNNNQELLALGVANLASGMAHGFPVGGGMSQSVVNTSGGAKTPLSGFVASLILLIVTLFLSGLLRNLPQPVLAAVVLVAISGLFRVQDFKRLWYSSSNEFVVAVVALLGVLGFGLLDGVLVGAVISLALLLRRASRPRVAFLGRIPGTQRFSDMDRNTGNEPIPGMLVFRVEAGLLYFNTNHVHDAVLKGVRDQDELPKLVLCDLSSTPFVDLHGADMLAELATDLEEMGVRFHVVEARANVRDTLRAEGLETRLGEINRFTSVADVVNEFLSHQASQERS